MTSSAGVAGLFFVTGKAEYVTDIVPIYDFTQIHYTIQYSPFLRKTW